MEVYPRISDIPFTDLFFLADYYPNINFSRENKESIYKLTKDLIFSNKLTDVPNSIINWIKAYNANQKYDVGTYNISFIIRASNEELKDLFELLNVNNDADVVEVLNYLNKLIDDFSLLPDDVVIKIMKNLDYYQLKILSKTSKKVEKIYKSKEFEPILRNKYWSRQYTGLYADGKFKIVYKNNPQRKVCKMISRSELVDIMWSIGVQLPNLNYDNEFLIYHLIGAVSPIGLNKQIHPDKEISGWSSIRLNYYYEASNLIKYPNKDILCEFIRNRMDELGSIEYVKTNNVTNAEPRLSKQQLYDISYYMSNPIWK